MGSFSRKLKRAPHAGTVNGLPSLSAQIERFAQPLLEGLGVADESSIQGLGGLISLTWNMGGRPALPQDEQNVRSLLGMITGAAAGQADGEPTLDAASPVPDGEPVPPLSPEAEQLKQAQEVMTTELMAMVERRRTLFGDDRRGVSGCTLHRRGKKGIEIRATEGELPST